jgi:hypothetical protein
MRRYLKFAAGFWMSAFLVTGSLVIAPTAKAKRKGLAHTIPGLQR